MLCAFISRQAFSFVSALTCFFMLKITAYSLACLFTWWHSVRYSKRLEMSQAQL